MPLLKTALAVLSGLLFLSGCAQITGNQLFDSKTKEESNSNITKELSDKKETEDVWTHFAH